YVARTIRHHADAGAWRTVIHRHQVDRVVAERGGLHRLHHHVAQAVHAAVTAIRRTQRGDGEREAQVGIERLAVRRGSHEVVDAGLRLATLDVEVDAHHLRRHVARQEDG